jgi:phosphatidylglycerophosphate synthase
VPSSSRAAHNPLTVLRLLLLPVLWALALARQPVWLAAGLAAAVLTDVLDGRLAKHWPRFADGRFDALADKLLTFSVAVWLVLLRPQIFSEHPWLLLATTLTYAADLIYGWIKFKRVPGLHLHLGKLGGALQAVFVLHALLWASYSPLLLYLALGVFILAASEELAILITHPEIDEEQVRSIVPYLKSRWRSRKDGDKTFVRG